MRSTVKQIDRILIQTVGTGGQHNPVWEAIAFTVRDRRPDLVAWLCSQQTKEQTLPKVKRAAGDCLPEDCREFVCADPGNVEQLYREYATVIDDLRHEFPGARIEVDYTSGTKPMSAALVLAGVARAVHLMHYGAGRHDDTGRATQTERLVTLSPDVPYVDRLIGELGNLFNHGDFDAVLAHCNAIRHRAQLPQFFQRVNSLGIVAKIYSLWDRFEWRAATGELQQAPNKESLKAAGWDDEALRRQYEHVRACNKSWNSPERLADLLANADRRISRGNHDDAVARLYRLAEYIGQIRFAACFGIDRPNPTSNVPLPLLQDRTPQLAADIADRCRTNKKQEPVVSLGQYDTAQVLAEAGDSIGMLMLAKYEPPDPGRPGKKGILGALLDQRNDSLLAHGSQPVGSETATALRELIAEILDAHLKEAGQSLEECLAPARFLKCPWAERGS
jgi:CRISPR-associated protein (TIGR02710 family)